MVTLEEIENVTFHKAGFGGYRVDEVDRFVDDVVEKVKGLELAQKELELKIENQEAELQKYKEKEDSVQSALINAQVSAKQTKADAERKSLEKIKAADEEAAKKIEEAEKKAAQILSEAQEKADRLNTDTDAQVEELMNKALKESSDQIEENNRTIEEQKKSLVKLMSEANKFRNTLLQTYKTHLGVINSMAKGEDYKRKQKELEENYPTFKANKPEVREEVKAEAKEEVKEETKAEPQEKAEEAQPDEKGKA